MNILYIAPQKIVSGASLSLVGLVNEMSKNHQVWVIVEDERTEYAKKLKKAGANLIEFPMVSWIVTKRPPAMIWEIRKVKWRVLNWWQKIRLQTLIKKIKELHIDVIHSNLRICNIGGIIAKELDIPHIWHIREFGEEDFDLYTIYNDNEMYNFMNETSAGVIAISQCIKDKFDKYFKNKIVCIYNGIDVNRFYQENILKLENQTILIGMTSVISPTKGQLELVKAISLLPVEIKKRIRVQIIGDCYNKKYFENLKEEISKNQLNQIIDFIGFVDNVEDYLKKIDILVVPSKKEGFGRVTAEGMMSGCIVLGAKSGATKELLEDNRGFLYEQGNIESLKNELIKIISHPDESKKNAQNGQIYAHMNFRTEKNAKEIEELYMRVKK
ncbi:glycosyltransferase family 4 protein [Lactobacillus intestinalis]|uniref:glycosyltransferase family 4 protein n=1 Tax=Lactobacillus intestinalis TaxID=151781 RepID=UPI0025A2EDD4|nr:glycosyltransferase family 4 protein [Lactobacillus intestinalis]